MSPFICGTRNLISQGFRSLPVLLGGAILFLGMTQANINLLFFFVGLCILAPTSAMLLNILWEYVFSNTPSFLTVPHVLWKLPDATADNCAIYTIGNTPLPIALNVVPSYWLVMMLFFFTYLFKNAYTLYELQENSKAPARFVSARKSQSMTAMVVLVIVGVIVTIMRYATGCETGLGVLASAILAYYMAHYWYVFMRQCGLGRLDDLFGIANRILPEQSYEAPDPMVCAPS
jgi:LytS/YehU family sensor histidine kinase